MPSASHAQPRRHPLRRIAGASIAYKDGGPTEWIKLAEAQLKLNPSGGDAGEGGWLTSYKDALAKAKKEKKVVLADFTGSDWCGWCIKLKDEVFSKPEFQEWAKEHVVLLELDFPHNKQLSDELKKQNEDLRKEFGIEGFPTIVFMDAKGKKVGKSGYVEGGPAAWIATAEKELGIKSKPKAKRLLRDAAPVPAATGQGHGCSGASNDRPPSSPADSSLRAP